MDDQTRIEAEAREEFNRGAAWPQNRNARVVALVVAAAAVLLTVGAGAYTKLTAKDERSTTEVEQQIRTWLDDSTPGGDFTTVTCPDPIEWRVGGAFHCVAQQRGQSIVVTVSMENEQGAVTYSLG